MADRQVVAFRNHRGRSAFEDWFHALDRTAARKVAAAVLQFEQGNLGDSKQLRGGIRERRVHSGPGYRIYFGLDAEYVVLLNAGTKRSQVRDIERARCLWDEYRQSTGKLTD